ncbi:hypothetical protein ACWGNZ_14660 [Sphingomonas zeae]
MLPALLILSAVILQGLGAWCALAGALAFACQFDPATIGLPAVRRPAIRYALWALVFAIGLVLTLAGAMLAAYVIGPGL